MKCDICKGEIKSNCDWRQGRCPHLPPQSRLYKERFLNLMKSIQNLFKK